MAGFGLGDACGHFEVPVRRKSQWKRAAPECCRAALRDFLCCFYYSGLGEFRCIFKLMTGCELDDLWLDTARDTGILAGGQSAVPSAAPQDRLCGAAFAAPFDSRCSLSAGS